MLSSMSGILSPPPSHHHKDVANFHRPKALWYPHDIEVPFKEQGKLATQGQMKIIMKSLGGKRSKLHVDAKETISSVKAKAFKKLDFKLSKPVKIYYSGKELEDNKTLAEQDESQFNQVLNIELNQIIESCKLFDEKWSPKFVVIVAQKNHHTKFFQTNSPDNVQPGTMIDNKVCHPKNNYFYLCAHAGMIGTTRPTHYHVLLDEVGLSANDLQELVHSLSYVYQRSTTSIFVVAPICYAHLAATQLGQWM